MTACLINLILRTFAAVMSRNWCDCACAANIFCFITASWNQNIMTANIENHYWRYDSNITRLTKRLLFILNLKSFIIFMFFYHFIIFIFFTLKLQQSVSALSKNYDVNRGSCRRWRTQDLHHCLVQDIRRRIESEYNAAVDAEIAAARDFNHIKFNIDCHKSLRSDAFRALVNGTGIATKGGAIWKSIRRKRL